MSMLWVSLFAAIGLIFFAPDRCEWSSIQLFRSVFGRGLLVDVLNAREESIWSNWEAKARKHSGGVEPAMLEITVVTSLSDMTSIDLTKPFLAKNMSNGDVLTIMDMLTPPLSDLKVDYFSDARRKNTVPDAFGPVGEIVTRILEGGPEKFGTQMILKAFPVVMERFLNENKWLEAIFGFQRVEVWRKMGSTVTVPVFMSRGMKSDPAKKTLGETTRTDLHCEPISNLVAQTVGGKVWTLIEPQYSYLLRPTVAPDGRAYFYSNLDPFDPQALASVPRYEVTTQKGDVLYVPTWTWHRVQYLPDITAVSISLFEFVPSSFFFNNCYFAATLVPNLIKELLGIKMQ